MDDLIAFVRARLDEDEAAARKADEMGAGVWALAPHFHTARHSPARVLREVAAKRAILADHHVHVSLDGSRRWCERCCDDQLLQDDSYCPTLRALAFVWSDHPDYRAEWAPRRATQA